MKYFEEKNGALIFRENGETVKVEGWVENSLRVRGGILTDISEESIALLPSKPLSPEITMDTTGRDIRECALELLDTLKTRWGRGRR